VGKGERQERRRGRKGADVSTLSEELLRVYVDDIRMLLNHLIHCWLSEGWLIRLIVTKSTNQKEI